MNSLPLLDCAKFSIRMLSRNDQRWNNLLGGRRNQYDPRPTLAKLPSGTDVSIVWNEFWNELHHQDDVGDASYASIPPLVGMYRERPTADWNIYAMVAMIELARTHRNNLEVPAWLETSHFQAIQRRAKLGLVEITGASQQQLSRAILCVLAIAKELARMQDFFGIF